MRITIIILFVFMMFGCVVKPLTATPEELIQAKKTLGEAPTKKVVERLVTQDLALSLKDPDTAKYRYKKPFVGFVTNSSLLDFQPGFESKEPKVFGWVACFEVNAKNSYGGYTGYKPYFIMFQKNKVVYFVDAWGVPNTLIYQPCRQQQNW